MTLTHSAVTFEPRISGLREGFWVQIRTDGSRIVAEVDGRGRLPDDIELGAENLLTRTMAPDILTGDSFFDYRVRITGCEPTALAVLDRQTRSLVLREVVLRSATVDGGRITLRGSGLGQVTATVPRLLELANHLALRWRDVPARLADNAANELNVGVRVRNLRVLLEHFPNSDIAGGAARRALASEHPELRLEAGLFLDDEGREVVCGVATSEHADDDLRVRAVEHLTRASWAAFSIPVLEELLASRARRVRRAAIASLGRYRHRPAIPELEAMVDTADLGTLETIAEAMGWIGDPAAEPCLIRLLGDPDRRVKTAAVQALARVGTAQAVEPLRRVGKDAGVGALRKAARWAVERIQGRLVGAEVGQLSMVQATDHEGALSPVGEPDERGALSLEDRPGRQQRSS